VESGQWGGVAGGGSLRNRLAVDASLGPEADQIASTSPPFLFRTLFLDFFWSVEAI